MIEYEIKCDCGRFLGMAYGETIATMKCGNSKCKKLKNVKVVTSSSSEESIRYKFKEPSE